MDENRDLTQQLVQLAARQGLKRAAAWLGGGTLLLIILFVVLMAAIADFLGGGLSGSDQGPPIGTAQARPALWLDYPALAARGLPNVVVLSVMAHESGGQVLAENFNCSGGLRAGQQCAQAYPGTRTLSEDAGLMQINSGGWPVPEDATKWQSLGLADDPFDPAKNIPAGIHQLEADVAQYRYLRYALESYNSGSGGPDSTDTAYPAAVRSYISAYEAGPTISAWSTADYADGQWQVRPNEQVWLVVVAAGPYGAKFSVPWAPTPPKCGANPATGKTGCTPQPPEMLMGSALVQPSSVTVNGEPTALSSQGARRGLPVATQDAPLWPGEQAWCRQIKGPGTYVIVATWSGGHKATTTIALALEGEE